MVVEGFVIDREDGTRLKFLYFDPISEDVSADFEEVPVRGRSEPHVFYSQTGPDSYSFNIHLHASVDEYDGGTPQRIHSQYLFLKSFQFPDYGPGYLGPIKPPHQVIILIGQFFRKKGIIKQPGFTFHPPYDTNGFPYHIECRFTFREINDTPRSYDDVRSGLSGSPLEYPRGEEL